MVHFISLPVKLLNSSEWFYVEPLIMENKKHKEEVVYPFPFRRQGED